MRPTTFNYRLVQRVHIAVHGTRSPTNEEWDAYLQDIGARLEQIDAVYSWTNGGNLTGEQRQRTVEFWRGKPRQPPIAVVTPSVLVVRVAGALRWFMPTQIKTFLPRKVKEAFDYLKLDDEQRRLVTLAVEELTGLLPREGA